MSALSLYGLGITIIAGILYYLYDSKKKESNAVEFILKRDQYKERIKRIKESEDATEKDYVDAINDYNSKLNKHREALKRLGIIKKK